MFTGYTVFFWAKNNTDHKKKLKHLKRIVWQDKLITSCCNSLLATAEIIALSCFTVETNKAVNRSWQVYYGWSYVFGWLAVAFLFLWWIRYNKYFQKAKRSSKQQYASCSTNNQFKLSSLWQVQCFYSCTQQNLTEKF